MLKPQRVQNVRVFSHTKDHLKRLIVCLRHSLSNYWASVKVLFLSFRLLAGAKDRDGIILKQSVYCVVFV